MKIRSKAVLVIFILNLVAVICQAEMVECRSGWLGGEATTIALINESTGELVQMVSKKITEEAQSVETVETLDQCGVDSSEYSHDLLHTARLVCGEKVIDLLCRSKVYILYLKAQEAGKVLFSH